MKKDRDFSDFFLDRIDAIYSAAAALAEIVRVPPRELDSAMPSDDAAITSPIADEVKTVLEENGISACQPFYASENGSDARTPCYLSGECAVSQERCLFLKWTDGVPVSSLAPGEPVDERIARYLDDDGLRERLMHSLQLQMFQDDEAPAKAGRALLRAFLENDVDAALMAICGWRLDSLMNFTERGTFAREGFADR